MRGREVIAYEGEPFDISQTDLAFLRRSIGTNVEVHLDGVVVRRLAGHACLPSGRVLRVRSRKTSARSLLSWLAYCHPTLASLRAFRVAPELGEPGELAALTASLYASEVLRAASTHGLARAYVRRSAQCSVVRGQIDFAEEARALGNAATVACLVWDRSPETIINRWLATALRVVTCDALMREATRPYIPRLKVLLSGVPPLARNERLAAPPRAPRHLAHLETALALASLIIRTTHLDEGRTSHGASFFINLEWLFETTVVRAFQQARIECHPKHVVRSRKQGPNNDTSRPMQLDLYCPSLHGGLVVDAKYKTHPTASNLQQMVTYCFMTGARRAALVFPAGHLSERSRYIFTSPEGSEISIGTFELRTDAASADDWRVFGRLLVSDILEP